MILRPIRRDDLVRRWAGAARAGLRGVPHDQVVGSRLGDLARPYCAGGGAGHRKQGSVEPVVRLLIRGLHCRGGNRLPSIPVQRRYAKRPVDQEIARHEGRFHVSVAVGVDES